MMSNDTDEENDDMMNMFSCVQVKMEDDYDDYKDNNSNYCGEESEGDTTNASILEPIEELFVKEMPLEDETDNSPYILMDSDIYSESIDAEDDLIPPPQSSHLETEGIKIKECYDDFGKITYLCIACDMSFLKLDVLIHHMTTDHKGLVYLCFICREIFTSNENLKLHINSHVNTSLACEFCGLVLSTKRSLENHITLKHLQKSKKTFKRFICYICCDAFNDVNSFSQHMLTHKSMMLSCKLCQFWCDSDAVFQQHLKKHTIEKVYSCEKCEKTFQNQNDLNFHKKSSSCKKTNSLDAKKCPKKQKKNNRSLKCDECGKKFRNTCNLQKHMSSHSRKTLSCKICGNVYNYNTALVKHILRHDIKPSDIRSYIS